MIGKQRAAWKVAAWIFGLSRLMILLFSYGGVRFLYMNRHYSPVEYITLKPCTTMMHCFLLSWWRWDAVHYVEIAHSGYNHTPLSAFFPLFPLLMHGLGTLLGGSVLADYAAGLILANMCFYGALVVFYQLLWQEFGPSVAKNALIYVAFAPYAIFFFAGYTESLFLLLSLAVFFFLQRGKPLDWWIAGLCGLLAALTRPTGIVLLVPCLVLFIQRFGMRALLTREKWRLKLNALLSMALIPAGLLIYILYLWSTFGNPLIFHVEEAAIWHRYTAFPWVGTIDAIKGMLGLSGYFSRDVADVTFTFVPLMALAIGWKKLPLQYSLFSLAMVLFVLCEPRELEGLMSVPRYMLMVFPIFLLFALWSKNRFVACQLMIPFMIFFMINILQFATYGWVA